MNWIRYPGDFSIIPDSEAEKAVEYANLVKNFILKTKDHFGK